MTQRYAHLAKAHLASEIDLLDAAMPIPTVKLGEDGHYMDTKSIYTGHKNKEKC